MSGNRYKMMAARIRGCYKNLSETEQRIADYMLGNMEELFDATAEQIAHKAEVSPATVIRFCKKAGFSGLSEFRLSLKQEHDAITKSHLKKQSEDPLDILKERILAYHNVVINSLLANRIEEVYEKALDAIVNAGAIFIIGAGGSRAAALSLYDVMIQMGLPCELSHDAHFEMVRIGSLKKGDVLIAFTYSGRYKNTVDSMRVAKERNQVTTIGVIGQEGEALVYTDIHLNSNIGAISRSFTTLYARVAECAIVELLYYMLSIRLGITAEEGGEMNSFAEERRYPVGSMQISQK